MPFKLMKMNKQSVEVSGGRETYYVYRDCEVKKGDFVEIMESGVAIGDSKPTEEVTAVSGTRAYYMDSINLTDNRVLVSYSNSGYQNSMVAVLDVDTSKNTVQMKSTGALTASHTYLYFNGVKTSESQAVVVFSHENADNVCGSVIGISANGTITVTTRHTVIVSGDGEAFYVSADSLGISGSYSYVVIMYYMGGTIRLYQTYAQNGVWKSYVSYSVPYLVRSTSNCTDCCVCSVDFNTVLTTYSDSSMSRIELYSVNTGTGSGNGFSPITSLSTEVPIYHMALKKLTASTYIYCYQYNNKGYYRIITISGSGSSRTLMSTTPVIFHDGPISNCKLLKVTDNKVVVTYDGGARVIFIKSNGGVVVGDHYPISGGSYINASFVDEGNILMIWYDGSGIQSQVLFLSQDVFIEEAVVPLAYEKQVRPATTATPYGLALSSGMGGDYSEHKDTVIIAVPDNKGSSGTVVTKYEDIMPKQWQENVEGIDYSSNTEVVITAPTYRSSTTKLSNAFDGNASTAYHAALGQPIDVKIYFPRPVKINKAKIKIQSGSSSMPFSIVGSVDDISYDTLYTGYDRSSLDEITLTSPGYYQIYKIHKDGDSSAWHSLSEFQTTEYQIIE